MKAHRITPLLAPFFATFAAAAAGAQSYSLGELGGIGLLDDTLLGSAVDIDGSYAIAGGHGYSFGTGAAWIYERQSSGFWANMAIIGTPGAGDLYGWSVAIDGDRAMVGAPGDDDLGSSAGAVYAYERQPDGTWLEVDKLLASDGSAGHELGTSVSIDGDFAILGSPDGMTGLSSSGTAYVFERQTDGTWSEVTKLEPLDPSTNDDFGWSVSLSGTRAVAGAPLDDPMGPSSGSAYVFERQADGTWPQVDKLVPLDGDAIDSFGFAVAISGDYVVSGAWIDEDGDGPGTGSAYVFERQPDATWLETQKLQMPEGESGDHFGQSLDIDGTSILVGAIHDIVGTSVDAGSAHLYLLDGAGVWTHVEALYNPDIDKDDNFGHDVAISGGRVIIGSSNDDDFEDNGGTVTINFSYDAGSPGAVTFSGIGTPGCDGEHTLDMTLPAEQDSTGFGFECDNAPPSSVGFLGIGDAVDLAGSDPLGLGVTFYLDILGANFYFVTPMTSDADGIGFGAAPIPDDPNLVGVVLHAQAVWSWTTCTLGGAGLSSSNLVSFTVLGS
ncbi:MAG: hypothetical protein AAF682_11420 [Planctomycetota bacterium]